jgi:hypothetical protein
LRFAFFAGREFFSKFDWSGIDKVVRNVTGISGNIVSNPYLTGSAYLIITPKLTAINGAPNFCHYRSLLI